MQSLASVIAESGPGAVESDIFGTTDAGEIARRLASIVETAVSIEVAGAQWYRSSVAAVAGVVLRDGRTVVARAYQRSASIPFVEGVVRAQTQLAGAGFPCPFPLSGPVAVDDIVGRVEAHLSDPGPRCFDDAEMGASAAGLARIVDLAAAIDPTGLDVHPMQIPAGQLYPAPHSPVFDFDATASGAEWIDDIAAAARDAMRDDHLVIVHGDWSARNVRLGPGGVVAAYDWESLQHGPESTSVGVAAATWRSVGEPNEPPAPSADEIRRYVEHYEQARSHPFTVTQRRSAYGAALFGLAYTARCEHALQPGVRTGRASGRLATDDQMWTLLR